MKPAPKPKPVARVIVAVVDGKLGVTAEGKLSPSQATDLAALVARWARHAKGETL